MWLPLWQKHAGLPSEPPVLNNYRVKEVEAEEEEDAVEEFQEVSMS